MWCKVSPKIDIKNFFRLNLRRKFLLINLSIILLLSFVTSVYFFNLERTILYERVTSEAKILGETLSIPIVNDLVYERLGLVEEGGLLDNYISEIFSEKKLDFLYIAVLDENNKVISHTDISKYGTILNDEFAKSVLSRKNTVIDIEKDLFFGKTLTALTPLFIGDKKWGTLRFAISLENSRKALFASMIKVVIITLFFMLLGYLLVLYLGRIFVKPITDLTQAMAKTTYDNLKLQVDIKGDDEFSYLLSQLNDMLFRIKSANEELKKKNEMLIQSEKLASIGILASGIAHEINNPLGGLFNCVHILKEKKGENLNKYLSLIDDGLTRIKNTITKLLWMARKKDDNEERLSLNDVLDSILYFVNYQVAKKNIVIEKEVDNDLELYASRTSIEQIFLNLIINAYQAITQEGKIYIRAMKNGDYIDVQVEDTGTGISKDYLPKIFDPFFTTKKPGEGTGLGLWITYDIVKNLNGEISVKSEEGKGTIFYIKLPMRQDNEKKHITG